MIGSIKAAFFRLAVRRHHPPIPLGGCRQQIIER